MALPFTAAVLDEHSNLMEEEIDRIKEVLTNKAAVPDYATYLFNVGKVAGLRKSLELCKEAINKLNES